MGVITQTEIKALKEDTLSGDETLDSIMECLGITPEQEAKMRQEIEKTNQRRQAAREVLDRAIEAAETA